MTRTLHLIPSVVPLVLVAGLAHATVDGARGIYLTADDFTNGRLTSESDCASPGHKIELHDVLKKPYIHVTHAGETRRYEKREVYGFRSCRGVDYRFVGNDEYQILEARGLSIYAVELPAREGEDLAVDRETVRRYFFSVGAGGQVLRLSRDNLKRALPENHTFHDSLDQMFATDQDLALYDTFHKMFKVNRLLIASLPRTSRPEV